ncbi:MAG: UbiA family prenyltransferase, partial [Acidobacteria bacterium]|nr:UbiA family prenyltransferase [Acidobacteriota bacterium]
MTTFPGAPAAAVAPRSFRYFTWLRLQDVLVLQGPPLLGAAFALRHPSLQALGPLAMLMIGNLLLMAHVFMLNDWAGLTADLADPNKADRVFTARGVRRGEVAGLTAGLLVLSLVIFARLGVIPFALALAIAILSALYSLPQFHWKGRPLFNSIAHLAGGILHFLLGYSLANAVDRRGL